MKYQRNYLVLLMMLLTIPFLTIGGCDSTNNNNSNGSDSGDNGDSGPIVNLACPETNLSLTVCDPENGPFTVVIDNGFFPLVVGSSSVLEGVDDEGALIRVEIDVLDETEEVAGVTTRVVTETEFEDEELVEISRNFFAQAPDGTVCYFGEDVDDFEDGEIVGNDGEWRAGENGNLPGIFMPANPQIGDVFSQEFAPGIALDQTEITDLGATFNSPFGTFTDTLSATDCDPLDDGSSDDKIYVDGIGLALDATAELISFE